MRSGDSLGEGVVVVVVVKTTRASLLSGFDKKNVMSDALQKGEKVRCRFWLLLVF